MAQLYFPALKLIMTHMEPLPTSKIYFILPDVRRTDVPPPKTSQGRSRKKLSAVIHSLSMSSPLDRDWPRRLI